MFKYKINPLASPISGAPALKYGDVNTETTSPGEVKVLISTKTKKISSLTPDNCPDTIERIRGNSIIIDDHMLSRIHCTINFDNIQDGYDKNGFIDEEITKSTNSLGFMHMMKFLLKIK